MIRQFVPDTISGMPAAPAITKTESASYELAGGTTSVSMAAQEAATAAIKAALNEEWHAKYERLWESHRKLQKVNSALEDKLLRMADKFEGEKNGLTRDLALQTQKLVQAKLTVQQLHQQNQDLEADLHLSINLLRNNRPSNFMPKRMDALPPEMRSRVRSCMAQDQQLNSAKPGGGLTTSTEGSLCKGGSGRRITVAVDDDYDGEVSAAILAKVLEERDKERKRDNKFCIDVGTQTHSGWHFKRQTSSSEEPSETAASSIQSSPVKKEDIPPPHSGRASHPDLEPAKPSAVGAGFSSLQLTSVILPPPPISRQVTTPKTSGLSTTEESANPEPSGIGNLTRQGSGRWTGCGDGLGSVEGGTTGSPSSESLPTMSPLLTSSSSLFSMAGFSASAASSYLTRSSTFSAMQTDL